MDTRQNKGDGSAGDLNKDQLPALLRNIASQVETLQNDAEGIRAINSGKDLQIRQLEDTIKLLTTQLHANEEKLKTASLSEALLKAQITDLQQQLETAATNEQKASRLRSNQNTEAKAHLTDLQTKFADLEQQLSRYEQQSATRTAAHAQQLSTLQQQLAQEAELRLQAERQEQAARQQAETVITERDELKRALRKTREVFGMMQNAYRRARRDGRPDINALGLDHLPEGAHLSSRKVEGDDGGNDNDIIEEFQADIEVEPLPNTEEAAAIEGAVTAPIQEEIAPTGAPRIGYGNNGEMSFERRDSGTSNVAPLEEPIIQQEQQQQQKVQIGRPPLVPVEQQQQRQQQSQDGNSSHLTNSPPVNAVNGFNTRTDKLNVSLAMPLAPPPPAVATRKRKVVVEQQQQQPQPLRRALSEPPSDIDNANNRKQQINIPTWKQVVREAEMQAELAFSPDVIDDIPLVEPGELLEKKARIPSADDFTPNQQQDQQQQQSNREAEGPRFQEVVRKKDDREKLPAFECEQCKRFFGALETWGTVSVNNLPMCGHIELPRAHLGAQEVTVNDLRQEAGRHRYRNAPPSTPTGFWNIGFTPPNTQADKKIKGVQAL